MNTRAIDLISTDIVKYGQMLGFDKLTDIHSKWMWEMLFSEEDETLQAHRGSYKTTCITIVLSALVMLKPHKKMLFMRKTNDDVKEVISQVKKILENPKTIRICNEIYGVDLKLTTSTATEITTNLAVGVKGTNQLVGLGCGSSITGKHFDYIFTDDIVNVDDRTSKAERDRIKLVYQELQNIKNRGGRIFNTGTPWHKDDCFTLMPNPIKYDCYSTGLISADEIDEIKKHMTNSLFCANYELKHVSDDDVIFPNPKTGYEAYLVEQGISHIDAAYGGEDGTAFTIVNRVGKNFYVLGKLYHKHIENCQAEIIAIRKRFNAGKIHVENNGDKGYLAKELRKQGERVAVYHEDMNKYLKITSYLKYAWENVYFVEGTDKEYIDQIVEYNENAEHDDAPDSLASLIRVFSKKSSDEYKPIFMK